MKILCIAGPTGSGKTAFSLEIAQYLKHHDKRVNIINVDSCQLYKDFPIISAQPTKEELNQENHMLFGILGIKEKSNAGFWIKEADKAIKETINEGKVPILVGGTGMYFKTLLNGIIQIPEISNTIKEELESIYLTKGIEYLYKELQVIDKEYSNKIHKNDKQRIIRGLEVFRQTNKCLSTWHKEHQEDIENSQKYKALQIGIGMPLDELSPYLYKRTKIMLENGALEEAKHALELCPEHNTAAFSSIGCKELIQFILGTSSLEESIELWNKNTRAYAKRQWTWFRADKSIQWCHPFDKNRKEELFTKTKIFFSI